VTPDPARDHPAAVLRDEAERLRQTAELYERDGRPDAAALARAKAAASERAAELIEAFGRGKWFRLR
jgi:hypothetical protein